MNDNYLNKKQALTEIETLLSNKKPQTENLHAYCEYMKKIFLSCSTDN